MEREIDLTPQHLVAWLRDDLARTGGRRLEVRATREFLCEAEPVRGSLAGSLAGAGLDAEDDVEVLTTVGTLEVTPAAGGVAHWVLRLRVEDAIGSHLPDEGSVPDEPEEIGLETFAACFLEAGEPDATVTLEVAGATDRRGFDRVLARILADRHGRA